MLELGILCAEETSQPFAQCTEECTPCTDCPCVPCPDDCPD